MENEDIQTSRIYINLPPYNYSKSLDYCPYIPYLHIFVGINFHAYNQNLTGSWEHDFVYSLFGFCGYKDDL